MYPRSDLFNLKSQKIELRKTRCCVSCVIIPANWEIKYSSWPTWAQKLANTISKNKQGLVVPACNPSYAGVAGSR
jgi:hypothetical protein